MVLSFRVFLISIILSYFTFLLFSKVHRRSLILTGNDGVHCSRLLSRAFDNQHTQIYRPSSGWWQACQTKTQACLLYPCPVLLMGAYHDSRVYYISVRALTLWEIWYSTIGNYNWVVHKCVQLLSDTLVCWAKIEVVYWASTYRNHSPIPLSTGNSMISKYWTSRRDADMSSMSVLTD